MKLKEAKEEQMFLQLLTRDSNNRIYLITVFTTQTVYE
jgi:hypothetical protein